MAAALAAGHGVYLVNDDGADGLQGVAAPLRGQQQIEGLGGGDQDVWWVLGHGLPLRRWSIAGADQNSDFGHGQPHPFQGQADLLERLGQVFLDIVT